MKTQEETSEVMDIQVEKKTWINPTMEFIEIENKLNIDLLATVAS
ncbi:hypothetical protein Emtol_1256 [Emticicia oligotrophica DSM 17448]|uniref:Uncharacterized protein n=1 Tax=Emticicia oligotrophica (strain DSM 17448 / CIP 109782 / MTCC 6937 / GPTSA100-15) TaxID=929562 RepID=A0ABN4ADE2_EMTOG|nr:hypothetical protein [Emticicia oligotrophica]AFK02405.1 hypothetical protein Emtol_1256 [Emticicia oligotrophica DSM 17448]